MKKSLERCHKRNVRWILLIWIVFLGTVGLALPQNLSGGVADNEPSPEAAAALQFISEEMPGFHSELQVLLKLKPSIREELLVLVVEIHMDYLRYSDMNPELVAIFLTIKRREYQNQLLAEKLHKLNDPTERGSVFKKLADHMNVTFDLNLKLVRGELAWLENQVRGLRQVAEKEKVNKKRYLKEDLIALLLDNEPLLSISIQGLGASRTAAQQLELEKLIERLPRPAVDRDLP
jgi:hypothetical protein